MIDWPQINLHRHLHHAISHVSHLISTFVGIPLPSEPISLASRPFAGTSLRTKLRSCGLLLRRTLLLGSCWNPTDHSQADAAALVTQVADVIIIPLISHFDLISRRYAEQAFNISLGETSNMASSSSIPVELQGTSEPVLDLRIELSRILLELLAPFTQPVSTTEPEKSSLGIRRNSSNVFIPLSGTTAVSAESDENLSEAANLWFGDIILYLAAVEISRLTCKVNRDPSESTYSANLGQQPSSDTSGVGQEKRETVEAFRIAREETVWHLCSLVHACLKARRRLDTHKATPRVARSLGKASSVSGITSSANVIRGARGVLMQPLLLDQVAQKRRFLGSRSQEGSFGRTRAGLGLVERELMTAAVDALNDHCDDAWEGDEDGFDDEGATHDHL